MKSTNMLERLNQELKRRTHVVRIFPNAASCLRLVRALAVETHENWLEAIRYLSMGHLAEHKKEMLRKLEAAFANWPTPRPDVPPVPGGADPAPPGLYRIQKDVNQGRVSIGLLGVKRDSPDIYALEVMNEILGGSGFAARITKTVRSNEGLAYSAGSGIGFGVYSPGTFRAAFQSKSRSVARALELVLHEIRRMREAPVDPQELDTPKRSLIETFPSNFASKAQSMGVFAADEYTGRAADYWTRYRERIAAVTAQDVQRVAREHATIRPP